MSAISPRSRRAGRLSLLLAAALLSTVPGCLAGEGRRTFCPRDDALLRAKADPRLRKEAEAGGNELFSAVAVYRNDVFLDQSEALGGSSLTVLNEMGRAAILLLSPGQIVPLLRDPSLRKATWLGPQGRLVRLDPSLELDMLARFGAGTEDRDVGLLLRFRGVGGAGEERLVAAAGFRVVSKAGPNWVAAGPMSNLPMLLESDRIIYIEGAEIERAGVPVTKEVPHSAETIPEIRAREKTNPLPPREDTAIPSHRIPRGGSDNDARRE